MRHGPVSGGAEKNLPQKGTKSAKKKINDHPVFANLVLLCGKILGKSIFRVCRSTSSVPALSLPKGQAPLVRQDGNGY
jgi:hypothetical protein